MRLTKAEWRPGNENTVFAVEDKQLRHYCMSAM